jgi:hypothetical protein
MPERKPYVYRGDPEAAAAERKLARIRAQAARNQQVAAERARVADELAGGPDVDGPGYEWYREAQLEQAEAPPAVVTPPAPAPARPVKTLPPEAERYRRRDVPTGCPCRWRWDDGEVRWVYVQKRRGCPWHIGRAA